MFTCLDSQAACTAWRTGNGATRPTRERAGLCARPVTRQGRDFDTLARDHERPCTAWSAPTWWAVAAATGWPTRWATTSPSYVADMVTLAGPAGRRAASHWVGTSMGGLIGLGLAALPGSPVQRLVLNDVGPVIEYASLQRIGTYLGMPAQWPTLDAAADALWAISQGFGPHSRDQWLALTAPQLKPAGGRRGRRLQAALRPGHRRALPPGDARAGQGRRGPAVAKLRPRAMPHAADPRRAV